MYRLVILTVLSFTSRVFPQGGIFNATLADTTANILYFDTPNVFYVPANYSLNVSPGLKLHLDPKEPGRISITPQENVKYRLTLTRNSRAVISKDFMTAPLPPLRIALGDSLKRVMTVEEIMRRPYFRAYRPGLRQGDEKLKRVTVRIQRGDELIRRFDLQENLIRDSNGPKARPPRLDGRHAETIKALQHGDILILENAEVHSGQSGTGLLPETRILIR